MKVKPSFKQEALNQLGGTRMQMLRKRKKKAGFWGKSGAWDFEQKIGLVIGVTEPVAAVVTLSKPQTNFHRDEGRGGKQAPLTVNRLKAGVLMDSLQERREHFDETDPKSEGG